MDGSLTGQPASRADQKKIFENSILKWKLVQNGNRMYRCDRELPEIKLGLVLDHGVDLEHGYLQKLEFTVEETR